MILAGDVGGTKTRLALYEGEGSRLVRKMVERFESRSVSRFQDLARSFLEKHKAKVAAACIGVPGPVLHGRVKTTNLPWELSESELSTDLAIPQVRLVNDLLATVAAVPHFAPEDVVTIHTGRADAAKTMAVVVAPGTGLGQAFLHFIGDTPIPAASEGGHADFAPNGEEEAQLYLYLHKKFPHVSYERVLCGSGLVNIYSFLRDSGFASENSEVSSRMAKEDPAAVISIVGLAGKDRLCAKALDMFAAILGAQAGNLVLTLMSTSGVYLGGGIPPKILPKLQDGTLLKSYLSKGRLSNVVQQTPVYVIRDDHAAVLGAAHIAHSLTLLGQAITLPDA